MRSSTLMLRAFSRLRIWAGERSLSNKTTSASVDGGQLLQFVDLALAEIGGHVGRFAPLGELPDDAGSGRFGQARELIQADLRRRCDGPAARPPVSPLRWRHFRSASFQSRLGKSSKVSSIVVRSAGLAVAVRIVQFPPTAPTIVTYHAKRFAQAEA